MNFDFENKEDYTRPEPESINEPQQFEDISSHSDNGERVDIMANLRAANNKTNKKARNKKRIIINVVTSVVLVLSVLMATVMGWFIGNADISLKDVPLLRALFGSGYEDIKYDDEGKTESGDFEDLKINPNEDVTYFLVVGCDWTSSKQTDVIVVVCMDHKNKTVSMLQIPRDTYVEGGYSIDGKINSVYANAKEGELKINALRRCLSNQMNIPIDHYILFSIKGAVNVVDAIGGIEMNLKNKIKIENPLHFGKYYYIGGKGKTTLSGKDAIGFMRKRAGTSKEDPNYDGSDIGRVKQQRKFYAALFKELLDTSSVELWKIANSCFNQVQTDLTLNETVAFANAAKKLTSKDIHIFGLPGQACSYGGVSYYSVHKDEYVSIFNKYFNPYGKKISEASAKIPELYVMAGQAKNNYWMSTDDSTLKDY